MNVKYFFPQEKEEILSRAGTQSGKVEEYVGEISELKQRVEASETEKVKIH